jgi:hypothetical protein
MIGFILAIVALIIGAALWAHINLGSIEESAVPIAIVCLALALLIGPAIGYVRGRSA